MLGNFGAPRGGSGSSVIAGSYVSATRTVVGKAPAGSTVTVRVNGTSSGTTVTGSDGRWSFVFSSAPHTNDTITASATVVSKGLVIGLPETVIRPPAGYQFITGSDGFVLTGADGALLYGVAA